MGSGEERDCGGCVCVCTHVVSSYTRSHAVIQVPNLHSLQLTFAVLIVDQSKPFLMQPLKPALPIRHGIAFM